MTNEFEFVTKYSVLVPPECTYEAPAGYIISRVQVDENGYRLAEIERANPERERIVAIHWPPRFITDHTFRLGTTNTDPEECQAFLNPDGNARLCKMLRRHHAE